MVSKELERQIYNHLRMVAESPANTGRAKQPGVIAIREAQEKFGIAPRDMGTLLAKWDYSGWWEYGVALRGGWFTAVAPVVM